jgi:hypothetical protein
MLVVTAGRSRVPSSVHVDMEVRIKFLASGCLLPYFLKLARAQVYCNNPDLSCDCHRYARSLQMLSSVRQQIYLDPKLCSFFFVYFNRGHPIVFEF